MPWNMNFDTQRTSVDRYFPNHAPKRDLSDDEKSAVKKAFYNSDAGHKGYLTFEDMKVAILVLFGYKPSKHEVRKMWPVSTEISTEGLNLSQFEEIMYKKLETHDEDDKIRQTFLTFDTGCRGFLTIEDVRKIFSQVAHLPNYTIDAAFHELDRDGDGRISFRDFEFMMKYNPDCE